MCGIVAMLSTKNRVSSGSLDLAIQSLRHRGPDHNAHWISPDKRIGLGHTRLSIVDLETGDQPIANETGHLQIVASGEFYDFEKIRYALEAKGHTFRTYSDSEIALHLYEDAGTECLEQLDGEFAFIIWDETANTLFAARDRFGINPLFYARINDPIYIASEVKALLAAGVPAKWDHKSVFQNLFFCLDQERSLFEGVYQVPPGHYLLATSKSLKIVRYWDVNYPKDDSTGVPQSDVECIEQLTSLLDNAVRLRMRADVPVGCYLSGGLDSSAVLNLSVKHATQPVTAFTIGFDQQEYDESTHARFVAESAGVDFELVSITDKDYADNFVSAVCQGEGIQYNTHGVARYLLSRSVHSKGYKAVLSGEGADECFAGYGFCRKALTFTGSKGSVRTWLRIWLNLLSPINQYQREIKKVSPWLTHASQLHAFPEALLKTAASQMGLIRSLMSKNFLQDVAREDPYGELFSRLNADQKLRGREPVKQILYLWLKTIFANYLLGAERLDMAHAVEVRLPFLDRELFEFSSQIPTSLLAQGDQSKYVLRMAAQRFVPLSVFERAKKPFLGPPATLRPEGRLHELTQDILRSDVVSNLPFLNRSAVVRFLDQLHIEKSISKEAIDPIVLMLTSLCVLQSRYHL